MRPIAIAILSVLAIAGIVGLRAPAALADQTRTENFDNGPGGVHYVTGTPRPVCAVAADLSVTCPVESFELAGVGNKNATATLIAEYSAIIDCNNPAEANQNNPVESHTQSATSSASSGLLSPKNGRLTVDPITATAPTEADFLALATCPNANWTPEVREGSITLVSFTYTVTFEGFAEPVITITGNDP
jgi:hypothetical protein